jgi:hypothetical protein
MHPPNPKTGKITALHCVLIVLAILWPYNQVAGHRFIEFDDAHYIYNNIYVINGLTWDSIVWAFTNVEMANWHPLTWISHMVDREIFGPHAGGYFLMNAAWHTVAAVLFYLALYRCTQDRFISLVVALVFAVHPANVENVAWASSRKSIMDAVCWGGGIFVYIKFLEKKSRFFYLLVVLSHILGLMFKPMHVTFPCTLWIIHLLYYFRHGTKITNPLSMETWSEIKSALRYSIPLLLLSAYFCFVTLYAQSRAMYPAEQLTFLQRSMNSIQSYVRYLEIFTHPVNLAPFYPLFPDQINWIGTIRPFFIISCVSTLFFLIVPKHPRLLLGWLWYLGTLVPVIGLVQVGSQSHADRYLYIPMIGLGIVLGTAFDLLRSQPKLHSKIRYLWISATTLSLMILTQTQVGYWRDGVTLFRHSLSVTGDAITPVITLAGSYHRQGRFIEGLAFVDEKLLVAKVPSNIGHLHRLRANMLIGLQEWPKALEAIESSITIGGAERKVYLAAAHVCLQLADHEKTAFYIRMARDPATATPTTFLSSQKSTSDEVVFLNHLSDLLMEKSEFRDKYPSAR